MLFVSSSGLIVGTKDQVKCNIRFQCNPNNRCGVRLLLSSCCGHSRGILVAWRLSSWSVSSSLHRTYSVSIKIKHTSQEEHWWLTTVYGPSVKDQKDAFLAELNELRVIQMGSCILCGDFNMIYKAKDKNNSCLDKRTMGQFRRFLNEALLKEIHLQGHLFTWSNERSHPTLERIDRAFMSSD
jgi:hypothetical protein